MPVHKMKFVLVNNMAPRNPTVCVACSVPLERGYLHDLSTLKCYCGIECHPRRLMMSGFVRPATSADPFELLIAWPMLTVDVASALFESAWSNKGG
jgi:hypothetical protein